MAKLSPSRISTVVDVSRRVKASTVNEPVVEPVGRVDGRGRRLQLEVDRAGVEDARREIELDAEGLVLDGDAVVLLGDRHRVLAAGEEARLLAGKGREVRLGEDPDEAPLLERVEQEVDLGVSDLEADRRAPDGAGARADRRGDQVERRSRTPCSRSRGRPCRLRARRPGPSPSARR